MKYGNIGEFAFTLGDLERIAEKENYNPHHVETIVVVHDENKGNDTVTMDLETYSILASLHLDNSHYNALAKGQTPIGLLPTDKNRITYLREQGLVEITDDEVLPTQAAIGGTYTAFLHFSRTVPNSKRR